MDTEKTDTPIKETPVPEVKESSTVVVSADDLAAPLAENMPEVTESLLNKETPASPTPQPEPPTSGNDARDYQDKNGKPFNAELHKSDANGKPIKDKAGFFISKNKGRKPGTSNQPRETQTEIKSVIPGEKPAEPSPIVSSPATHSAPVNSGPDEFDHAADMYLNIAEPLLCNLISEEWRFGFAYDETGKATLLKKDVDFERSSIHTPLAAYMRVKGKVDLPPGWALVIALAGYGGKRIQMPQTQKKVASVWERFKNWRKNRQLKN